MDRGISKGKPDGKEGTPATKSRKKKPPKLKKGGAYPSYRPWGE